MFALWNNGFPNGDDRFSTCNGSIELEGNGDICVTGRVNYQQLQTFVKDNGAGIIPIPAARTISINGHLIAGSGNVVLGGQTRYIYDYVTSYEIGGVSYDTATSSSIVDDTLAASRGTIDKVCLSSDFVTTTEEWYRISHNVHFLRHDDLDYNLLRTNEEIGLVHFSNFNVVVEFHKEGVGKPNTITRFTSWVIMSVVTNLLYAIPIGISTILPAFSIAGTSRLILAGTYTTAEFPNPLTAPDAIGSTVGVQLDTPWDNLIDAVENQGLFTGERVPLFLNVVIKRAVATGNNFACWGEGTIMAVIDVESPPGFTEEMDTFINEVVYPKLSAGNADVGLHFGKRLPADSAVLQSALSVYQECGAALDLSDVASCYHPLCDRTMTPREFVYPEEYSAPR